MTQYQTSQITNKFQWTEQASQRLKQLHETGMSDRQMAIALSEEFRHLITRNAIIGRRHRMGLADGPRMNIKGIPHRKSEKKEKVNGAGVLHAIKARHGAALKEPKFDDTVPFECTPVSLMDVTGCRWPVGVLYCNNEIARGSYCARHAASSTNRSSDPKGKRVKTWKMVNRQFVIY